MMTNQGVREKIELMLVMSGLLTHADIARRLGRAPQTINKRLNKKALNTGDLDTICGAVGWEWDVILSNPKNGVRL